MSAVTALPPAALSSCKERIFACAKSVVETVCRLAIRILFVLGLTLMAFAVVPIAMQPIVVPIVAVGALFIATFFYRKEPVAPIDTPCPEPLSPEVPRGIRNGGCNCWLNAALQILENDPSFVRALERKKGDQNPLTQELFSFHESCESAKKWEMRTLSYNTQKMRETMAPSVSSLIFDQEDACEGLRLIEGVLDLSDHHLEEENHFDVQGRTPISESDLAPNPAHLSSLELPITGSDPSLPGLIDAFCHEKFSEESSDLIEKKTVADTVEGYRRKGVDRYFLEAPEVLRLGLKRFEVFNGQILGGKKEGGFQYRKNGNRVKIPLELEIPIKNKENAHYRLLSVLCHWGQSAHAGHYVAYLRKGEQWFLANDSSVTPVSPEELEKALNSGAPYRIAYQKIQPDQSSAIAPV